LDTASVVPTKSLISLALPSGGNGSHSKHLKNKRKSASLLRECYHARLPPVRVRRQMI
jgi:hypothetical protein